MHLHIADNSFSFSLCALVVVLSTDNGNYMCLLSMIISRYMYIFFNQTINSKWNIKMKSLLSQCRILNSLPFIHSFRDACCKILLGGLQGVENQCIKLCCREENSKSTHFHYSPPLSCTLHTHKLKLTETSGFQIHRIV